MVKIKQQLIRTNDKTYGRNNKKKFVTVHQTGNKSKGANAQMHANYQTNGAGGRSSSWHWQVDDKEAIQSYTHDAQCWHAGDQRGNGNLHSIAVEICINRDGDYKKAVENGAKLVKKILDDEGLTIKDVKQHHDWSKKNCPAQIRSGKKGITWSDFLDMVEGEKSTEDKPKQSVHQGNSIVDYLISVGQNPSFLNRKKLAKQHGINNYRGTAEQNLELLAKLRGGSAPKKQPKTIKQMADEVIAGKHGNGHARRRKSLGISKSEYEKVRREVNRRF